MKLILLIIGLVLLISSASGAAVYDVGTNTITLQTGTHNFSSIDSDISNPTAWNYNAGTGTAILTAILEGTDDYDSVHFDIFNNQTLQINNTVNGVNYISLTRNSVIHVDGNVTIESIGAGRGYVYVRGQGILQTSNNETHRLRFNKLGYSGIYYGCNLQSTNVDINYFTVNDSYFPMRIVAAGNSFSSAVIKNFEITNSNGSAIYTYGSNNFDISDGNITDHESPIGGEAVRVGYNTTVDNVDFTRITSSAAGCALKAKEGYNCTFSNNTFTDITSNLMVGISIYVYPTDWGYWDRRIVIRDNVFDNVYNPIYWTKGQAEIYNNSYNGATFVYKIPHKNSLIYNETITNTVSKFISIYQTLLCQNVTIRNIDMDGPENNLYMRHDPSNEHNDIIFQDINYLNDITLRGIPESRDVKFININNTFTLFSLIDGGVFMKYSYVDVLVKDSAGNPISGATVNISNNVSARPSINVNGINQSIFTTGTDGHTPKPSDANNSIAVLEYWESQSASQQQNYTMVVNADGYDANTSVTFDPDTSWYRTVSDTYQDTITVTLGSWGYDSNSTYEGQTCSYHAGGRTCDVPAENATVVFTNDIYPVITCV